MRKFIHACRLSGIITFLLLLFNVANAQTGTVKGAVKDASGLPLNGASVTVEGKKIGTVTDANGNYSLKVPPGEHTIVVSFVGQSPQRMKIVVGAGGTVEQNFATTENSDLSNVVVVGSRSRDARSRIASPVPVDIIRTKDIKPFAQADVTQMLTYSAPSFQSSRQTISDGTDHIDPAGLRGLGPDQTLVLVNGKRRHNTALVNINGTVGRGAVGTDLNAIPASAIERIEVLRDGAAAQYGSDAIAGVINIVLKESYSGLNISAMAGQNITSMPYNGGTKINDGANTQIDFSGGKAKKGVGYFNFSGQWLRREQSNRSGLDNIPLLYLGNGGAFASPPPGYNTTDYRRWLIDQDAAIATSRGYNRRNLVAGNSYSDNVSLMFNGGANVGNNAEIYVAAGTAQRTGRASGFSRNPNSWNQQPVLANGQRFYYDGFLPEIHPRISDISVLAGIKFKGGKWNFDLSNVVGKNTIWYDIKNTGNASLPATNNVQTEFYAGRLSFRQNTANLDVSRKFDMGASKSINVAFGGEYRNEQFQIKDGESNSWNNGGRFATPDPIGPPPGSVVWTTFSPVATASGSQVFPGFKPEDALTASRNVYAAYGDVELTVGKFLLGGAARYENYQEKSAAYDNLSWKLTSRYEINPKVAIRGSISTGFRAPSLHQRYFQNTSTQFVAGLPSNALTANNNNKIVREAFGVDQLKPETSTSYTVGVAGRIGGSFTYTIDGYFISIKDRIVLSTQFNRSNPLVATILNNYGVDASTNALQFWTNAINTQTKGIDIVLTDRFRLGAGNASLSFAANFNRNDVVGGLNTNSVIDDPKNNPSQGDNNLNPANDLSYALFDRQQKSRIEVLQPRSKMNLTFNYSLKSWNFLARVVRFGEISFVNNLDPTSKNPNTGVFFNDLGLGVDQTFGARATTDLVVSYNFCPGVTLSAGGNNIFDIYPDRVFIDARNDPAAVYANPVQSTLTTSKTTGGYNAGRDASNRGRFLFNANQFGFNGRYLFARLSIEVGQLKNCKAPAKPKVLPPPPPAVAEQPKDTDGDGVLDKEDACPDVAGLKIFKGCPDTDGDGVADKDDACPAAPGPKVFNGCPDSDGDGIADKDDKCAYVPGIAKYGGCPVPDKDKDGVPDEEDNCPEVAGVAANKGCPEIQVDAIRKVAVAAQNILFTPGKATLLKQSSKPLNDVIDILNQYPDLKLNVEGHTDNTGDAAKNQALSQARAEAVKTYMAAKGIAESRMTANGFGQDKPSADNKTAAGRAKNRRVELKLGY